MYTLKGEVKTIGKTIAVTDSFKKRDFVIQDNSSQYPQTIQFQSVQDRTDLIDSFKIGDSVEVFFNLRGREWTNPEGVVKVFNTLDAWKIQPLNSETTTAETHVAEGEDDLPF